MRFCSWFPPPAAIFRCNRCSTTAISKTTVLVTEYYDPESAAAAARYRLQQHRRRGSLRRGPRSGERAACADQPAGDQSSGARAQDRTRRQCRAPARPAECHRAADADVCRAACLPAPDGAEAIAADTALLFRCWCARRASTPAIISFASQRRHALAAAMADFPGDDVWLIEQLDARDGDGHVSQVSRHDSSTAGSIHCILAISRDWKVHYFTADMAQSDAQSPPRRRISRRYGERHRAARHGRARAHQCHARPRLRRHRLRGESRTATFYFSKPMRPWSSCRRATIDKWAYRRPAFDSVCSAVHTMLTNRSCADSAAQPSGIKASARGRHNSRGARRIAAQIRRCRCRREARRSGRTD